MVIALTTFNLKIGTIFIYKCTKEIAQRRGLCNTKLCSHEERFQHGRVFRRKDQIRKTTLASPQTLADKLKNRRLSIEKIHSLKQKTRDDVRRSAHKRKRGIYERSRSSNAV